MKAAVASGVPEPSFRCVAEGVELSSEVLDLVRSLITRDPEESAPAPPRRCTTPGSPPRRRGRIGRTLAEGGSERGQEGGRVHQQAPHRRGLPQIARCHGPGASGAAVQAPAAGQRFGLGPRGKEEDEETRTPSGGSASPKRTARRSKHEGGGSSQGHGCLPCQRARS
ncbi:unnamed protein product [Prorocentrum cordatum]|uniref:Uncharacterized protein n=1 Tax=Prorocentrum cordatum TaxID=2364126 RepID=A0ABN9Q5E5_9DINO|nr:unnamed protein product [Polarella glacialis]